VHQTISAFFSENPVIYSSGHRLHTYCSVQVNSAFYPPRAGTCLTDE